MEISNSFQQNLLFINKMIPFVDENVPFVYIKSEWLIFSLALKLQYITKPMLQEVPK